MPTDLLIEFNDGQDIEIVCELAAAKAFAESCKENSTEIAIRARYDGLLLSRYFDGKWHDNW